MKLSLLQKVVTVICICALFNINAQESNAPKFGKGLFNLVGKDSTFSMNISARMQFLGTTQWDGFWLIITNKFSAIPLYIILLYLAFKHYGLKRTVVLLIFIALLIAASDQTSNLFKFSFLINKNTLNYRDFLFSIYKKGLLLNFIWFKNHRDLIFGNMDVIRLDLFGIFYNYLTTFGIRMND